ncbi:ATP-dependent DNA helicase [Paenibacillus ginsengarvi]|uniref:ATP-dependent DNA helicase n=1 Tax=Paenibacillus ginsengarvi TaxID=400777 RepID=A0A3B0CNE8_9BACL|nr:ATP-dependent DNA helicase [Paenibacillus ginsengarvi]RKN85907.1 ATP-dependent DNA helicase [Paenibacillus ginsengarvi]
MPDQVEVSVRALVEHVYRGGSIEAGFRTGAPLAEGTKAHRTIQNAYKETDKKEVYVRGDLEYEGIVYRIDGRCDGLLFGEAGESDEVTVEEIKSTSGTIALLEEQSHPVHWAQAKCYAYLYAAAENRERMRIRLTYIHRGSEERKSFENTASFEELEAFVRELIEAYAPFAKQNLEHTARREASVKELSFPFSAYRQGQRHFAGAVYKSVVERKRLFARAPTGTGKTISTLFPAVKAIGEGHLRRFFYVTAKTTTRAAAEEALALMRGRGLCLRSVTITAKDKICFKEETRCEKEYCEFADGYYDRINGALYDLWRCETAITRDVVEAYARKHRVCPFEFSLDAVYEADAVLCDYNYVYDPRISLKRLFEEQKRQTAILIDEAHNLIDRGREMYSAELAKAPFLELKRQTKTGHRGLYETAKAVNDAFIALRKSCGEGGGMTVLDEAPQALVPLLESFAVEAEATLAGGYAGEYRELLTDTYYAVQNYIRTAEGYDERYRTYADVQRSDVRLKLLCVDPSGMLRLLGKGYRSQIYFSATLSPIPYYRDMLGGEEDDYTLAIPSPFGREQLDVLLLPLSTRYRDREQSKRPIATAIRRVTEERPGNFLVFFPSYEYMNEVVEQFADLAWSGTMLVQQSGMSEEERDTFLASFAGWSDRTLVGFAVMGGVFAEGIDLTGDRLTGVVIVGVGLPQFGGERDLIRRFFDESGRNGFDYAYKFPGMNKVLQAGGRLIRTESDSGTLLLIDDRFMQPDYYALLPQEWKPITTMRGQAAANPHRE